MEVVGIWRYPVKSLQGESLTSVSLERDGLSGDRRWGIRDERTGRILTARRRPELLLAAATTEGDLPVVTLPGGDVVTGPGPRADHVLSEWLGSPVSLVGSLDTGPGRAEYFEDATDDASTAIEWTMPASRYVDAAPLLLLTSASLRAGAALHPAGSWEPRRFRPNLLVDVPGDGWVEDGWVGHPVGVGAAVVEASEGCVRCTMVTRRQPGLVPDRDIFRTLARHHGARFGLWCEVQDPARVALGDEVVAGGTGASSG